MRTVLLLALACAAIGCVDAAPETASVSQKAVCLNCDITGGGDLATYEEQTLDYAAQQYPAGVFVTGGCSFEVLSPTVSRLTCAVTIMDIPFLGSVLAYCLFDFPTNGGATYFQCASVVLP